MVKISQSFQKWEKALANQGIPDIIGDVKKKIVKR